MTNRFMLHYNQVVPFDEGVLETIWNRCRGPRCAAARRMIEGNLGMQEDGFLDFPAIEQGGATRHPAAPLESSPATRDFSPEPESN